MSSALNKRWAALSESDQTWMIEVLEQGAAGFVGATLGYIEEGAADEFLQDIIETATARLLTVDPSWGSTDAELDGEPTTTTPTRAKPVAHKLGSTSEIDLGGMKFQVGHFYRFDTSRNSSQAGTVWTVLGRGERGTVLIEGVAEGHGRGRRSKSYTGTKARINAGNADQFKEVYFSKCKGSIGPDGKPVKCAHAGYPHYGAEVTWITEADPNVVDSQPDQCELCKAESDANQSAIELAARREASKANVEAAVQRRNRREPAESGSGRAKPTVESAQMASKQQPTPSVVVPINPIGLRGVRRGGSDH